ncbi:MAG: AAA family ATPase [Cyanobacteria bacterium]|nr:AAA family ATPase [Cyanobacteria bacterium CG_2015-16_32_12]NCO78815.1 AAA family ATPase [Cyanobacteria bacterium CG_2015-22_32_23]NCQ05196.1 AAA family ATPase [Cyanobacteria bacterium CG_2015-09_32_10]NCQ41367.1 AAA family ATPase [Cyanobacteria bacterium CG_2015-04_32_10]NCS85896.1 AAA family ATPase [Cyanobacteria bacterium CG_2015-02_32_10]
MIRLIMLGGPGSGKGTQGIKIAKDLDITMISTGDIFRNAMATGDELAIKAREYVEKGELVPDMMMIKFMRKRLLQEDVAKGWVLEGYPRTAFQAEELDFLLEEFEQKITYAIYLNVSEETMIKRSLLRGKVDDELEVIKKRIELFKQRTTPILEYYEYKHTLISISGENSIEEVEKEIFRQINII